MPKRIKIESWENVYSELAKALDRHKESAPQDFIVEENIRGDIQIRIQYPGRKVRKRSGRIPWANLYDFLVVPYHNGKRMDTRKLQWRNLMRDFYENKLKSEKFWELLEQVYKNNCFDHHKVPKLPGINSELFLMLIKWMWIQEDLNYRLSSKDIPGCPSEYRNETKGGSPTRGAGRGKFYAALLLVKYHGFTPELIGRIIP